MDSSLVNWLSLFIGLTRVKQSRLGKRVFIDLRICAAKLQSCQMYAEDYADISCDRNTARLGCNHVGTGRHLVL